MFLIHVASQADTCFFGAGKHARDAVHPSSSGVFLAVVVVCRPRSFVKTILQDKNI